VTVLLNIPIADYQALAVLAKGPAFGPRAQPEDVIAHLLASALDGARRPGSWERGWIQQCGLWGAIVIVLALLGCGGAVETQPDAAAATSTSSGAGGAGGGCAPCVAACVGTCHPAGTPLSYCAPCGAGGGK